MFGDRIRPESESEPESERTRPGAERTRRRVRPLLAALAALLALASTAVVLAFVRRRGATPKLEPPF